MGKSEIIEYLNNIRPYINLKSICESYNKNTAEVLDYNNLRVVLNGQSTTRVSEEKLACFMNFIHKFLYTQIFDVYNTNFFVEKNRIENIIEKHLKNISKEIKGELGFEFSNK